MLIHKKRGVSGLVGGRCAFVLIVEYHLRLVGGRGSSVLFIEYKFGLGVGEAAPSSILDLSCDSNK
jgi:hypothetical protein